jgi:hypothetical protein
MHTKGPWKWEDSALVDVEGNEVIGIFSAHGEHKAWLRVNPDGNQTLIAAAPEMYEALKLALEDLYNTFPEEAEYELIDRRESIRKAEQAIKAAEGSD